MSYMNSYIGGYICMSVMYILGIMAWFKSGQKSKTVEVYYGAPVSR